MSSKKSPAAPAGRDAAIERLRKAEAAVAAAMALFAGKKKTPEEEEALKGALKELTEATTEARRFSTEADRAQVQAVRSQLVKGFGGNR